MRTIQKKMKPKLIINSINKIINSKINNKTSNLIVNNFNSLNISEKKSGVGQMINSEKMLTNLHNNNPQKISPINNYYLNKNIKNILNQNNSSFNFNPNLTNYNNFSQNAINNNLNEFMSINNNISKCDINYNTNINNKKVYDLLNNMIGHINDNSLNIAKNNVNNMLCSNINNCLYSSNFQQQNLPNNIFNNLVITNQMINPININFPIFIIYYAFFSIF